MLITRSNDAEAYKVIFFKGENEKEKKATAFVTLRTTDVTDFARIICNIEDDQKVAIPVTLSYFMDKGWVIDDKYNFIQAAAKDLFSNIIENKKETVVEEVEEVVVEEE